MRRELKISLMMVIITIIIGIFNQSNAFSFNANLSSDDKLVSGKEVKVTLSLSNIDMDDGIRSIKVGKITVGEEFEAIESTNFSSNTLMPTYSKGGLVLMSGTPIKDNTIAVTLTLKVKPGITTKSSTITFENIVASSGTNTGDISVGTKSITIKADNAVQSENQAGTETTDTISKTNTTNNIQNETNKQGKNTTTNSTSQKTIPSRLPNAGYTKDKVIVSLILVILLIGVVTFIEYKKYRC